MADEKNTQFNYLLNAVMHAAQEAHPAKAGYAGKYKALVSHVRELERKAAAHDARLSISDEEVLAWAKRHDLPCWDSVTNARAAFEDAQTLHLADGVGTPVITDAMVEAGIKAFSAYSNKRPRERLRDALEAALGVVAGTKPCPLCDAPPGHEHATSCPRHPSDPMQVRTRRVKEDDRG